MPEEECPNTPSTSNNPKKTYRKRKAWKSRNPMST